MAANTRRSLPGLEKKSNTIKLIQGQGKVAQKRKSVAPSMPGLLGKSQAADDCTSKNITCNTRIPRPLEVIQEDNREQKRSITEQDLKSKIRLKTTKGAKVAEASIEDKSNVDASKPNDGNRGKTLNSNAPNKKNKVLVAIAEESKRAQLSVVQEKHPALHSPIPLPQSVICIDDHDDSILCYTPEFIVYLRDLEVQQQIKPTSYQYRLHQDKRTLKPRKQLADWLLEVTHYFKTSQECLYQTINLLDTILSDMSRIKFNIKDIQLVGVSCLYIATKLEEYYPADLKELVRLTENSWEVKEIVEMEIKILDAVSFRPVTVDPMPFLNRNIEASRRSLYLGAEYSPIEERTFYELCIFNVDCLVTSYKAWEFLPSKKAAGAVYAALSLFVQAYKNIDPFTSEYNEVFKYDSPVWDMNGNCINDKLIWNATLKYYSGYKESEIHDLARQMLELLLKVRMHVINGGLEKDSNGITRKYQSISRHVGLLKLPELSIENIKSAILCMTT